MDSHLKHFHLICALLLCALACGQCRSTRQIDEPPPVSRSLHLFANDLYQLLERSEGNTVVSPLSLFTSLSMASLGAKGLTLDEIHRTLHLSPEALSRMGGIIASFQDVDGFDMANFLWVPRGVLLKADYAREMYDTFQTRVRDADFKRSELVRRLINRMIGNVTHGKIQEFLPTGAVSADTKVMMANAVYFKREWFHPFDESNTQMEPFFSSEEQSVNVPMMHLKETFRGAVLDDIDAKAIMMPYKENRFALVLVLPDRHDGLEELESQLKVNNYTATTLVRNMIHRDVDVSLPRFRIQYGLEMANILKQMGITELFGPRADLTRMSGSPLAESMKVSGVFHRATIEVNEGGSEASAASGLEIIPLIGPSEGQSGPMEFRADHPFIFYLIDRDNENLPVFMGRVTHPLDDSQSRSLAMSVKAGDAQRIDPSQSDRVIYPEAASRSIQFPAADGDEEPLINRVTRDSGSEKLPETVQIKPVLPAGTQDPFPDTPDLILRVKDKNWFKKPTAAEVIIPESSPSDAEPIPETTTRRVVTTTTRRRKLSNTRRPAPPTPPTRVTSPFRPHSAFSPSVNPMTLDGSAFAFEESDEDYASGIGRPQANPTSIATHPWIKNGAPEGAPPQLGDNGLFSGFFRPLQSWPSLSLSPQGNQESAQQRPPAIYGAADFGAESGVLFPNLRIVGKQIGDGISGILTSLTTTATKAVQS